MDLSNKGSLKIESQENVNKKSASISKHSDTSSKLRNSNICFNEMSSPKKCSPHEDKLSDETWEFVYTNTCENGQPMNYHQRTNSKSLPSLIPESTLKGECSEETEKKNSNILELWQNERRHQPIEFRPLENSLQSAAESQKNPKCNVYMTRNPDHNLSCPHHYPPNNSSCDSSPRKNEFCESQKYDNFRGPCINNMCRECRHSPAFHHSPPFNAETQDNFCTTASSYDDNPSNRPRCYNRIVPQQKSVNPAQTVDRIQRSWEAFYGKPSGSQQGHFTNDISFLHTQMINNKIHLQDIHKRESDLYQEKNCEQRCHENVSKENLHSHYREGDTLSSSPEMICSIFHPKKPSHRPTDSFFPQYSSKTSQTKADQDECNQATIDEFHDQILALQVKNLELSLSLKQEERKRRNAERAYRKEKEYVRTLEDNLQTLGSSSLIVDPMVYKREADKYIAARKMPVRRTHTCQPYVGWSDLVCDTNSVSNSVNRCKRCPSPRKSKASMQESFNS